MFAATGPLYRFGTAVYKYFTLNFLFLVFCVPVVTIPASTAGLFAVARKFVYKDDPFIFREFMRGFRQNFKQSSTIGLVILIASICLVMDYRAAKLAFGGLFITLCAAVLFIMLSVFIHVFPLMVHMDLKVKHIFLNAVKLAMIRPFLSVLGVMLIFVVLCLACLMPILFFTFFFSTLATAIYYLVNKKFERLDIVGKDNTNEK